MTHASCRIAGHSFILHPWAYGDAGPFAQYITNRGEILLVHPGDRCTITYAARPLF